MFGLLKKAAGAATTEVLAARNENTDVLEAYCAGASLMATADGQVEDSEKSKAIRMLSASKDLKGLFPVDVIEKTFDAFCKKAVDSQGRQELIEEFEDLKRLPDSQKLRDRIYLACKDIARADGEIEPQEQKRLDVLGKLLDVDASKFLMDDI
jgi:tellurite resistance protein TerB